jgi:uncharacterized membrane-anchored protein
MGESASDFLAHYFGPVPAVVIAAPFFVVAMIWQLRSPRYHAWTYWFAVVTISVVGTMVADGLHVEIGVPYDISTPLFFVALVAILTWWYQSERTISIHAITTTKRELFYWSTVISTFALGTAAGDLTATTLKLGYFSSAIFFAVLISLPALAFWKFNADAVLSFWAAYVVTRPLGASFADWFGVGTSRGGLAVGQGAIAIYLSFAIVIVVAVMARQNKRLPSIS